MIFIDFCGIALHNQIHKYIDQYMKSNKISYIIYADIEKSLIKKLNNCKNIWEKPSTTKIGKYIPWE